MEQLGLLAKSTSPAGGIVPGKETHMERIHIAVDAAQKAALYALAEDVGAIGQRGPSVQVLMAELAEMYIADPEQVVKIYAAQSERVAALR